MRRVRVIALLLLAVLTAAACGARLSPELRKQASTAALNAGSAGNGTGPEATTTTGPTGELVRVVRDHAECSPCLLRECPIDHRCMMRVSARQVTDALLELSH